MQELSKIISAVYIVSIILCYLTCREQAMFTASHSLYKGGIKRNIVASGVSSRRSVFILSLLETSLIRLHGLIFMSIADIIIKIQQR